MKILFRLLALLPFLTLLLIALVRDVLFQTYYFLRYGGEAFAFNGSFNVETVKKLLMQNQEIQNAIKK